MTRIIAQCMVSGPTITELSDNLDEKLAEGWEPFGLIFTATAPAPASDLRPTALGAKVTLVIQQMVKRETDLTVTGGDVKTMVRSVQESGGSITQVANIGAEKNRARSRGFLSWLMK